MYTHMINSERNFLSLAKLFKNSPNAKMKNATKEFFDGNKATATLATAIFDALYKENNRLLDETAISRIDRGENSNGRYENCADYLACIRPAKNFLSTCNIISGKWDALKANLTACNADTGAKISVVEALKILINGDAGFEDYPALRDWLNDALRNGEKYLLKVLTVVTFLAITRGNWAKIGQKLNHSGYLEKISNFPHYTDYDRFHQETAAENLETDGENSWKAYVCWRKGDLAGTSEYLDAALKKESDDFCKERLLSWLREAEEKLLENLIAAAKENKISQPVEDFLGQLQEHSWYGYFCWQVSEMFKAFGDEPKRLEYLSRGADNDEPYAMCEQMKILLPIDTTQANDTAKKKGLALAEKLLQMPTFPQLRGEAYYRLHLYTRDEKFLRNAYRCGSPKEAVKKYISGAMSFRETLVRADYRKPGHCILNVDEKNPVAQILAATIPKSWKIRYNSEFCKIRHKAGFSDAPGTKKILMYVFAKDDAAQNLNDFLSTLDALKDKPLPCAMFFIRGESEFLMPLVDTALHQWYAKDERPTIRVQILDDSKRAVQELFGRHPLFYALWAKEKAGQPSNVLHLILVGEGKTVPWLLREAPSLLTAVPRAKISLMSPHATSLLADLKRRYSFSDEIQIQPFNVSESQLVNLDVISQTVADNDAAYFVVDTGDSDLKNAEVARRLREIYIRAWVEKGTTSAPVVAPIAVHCADLNVGFMLRNSIVYGIEHGESWYNSQKFICYGGLTRYTWKNLVDDIFERIGVSSHMIYSKRQSLSEYLNALKNYARFTYNQDSSVAVAVSLPYRLYLLSRFDAKIIPSDWDITDGETFFAPENREIFLKSDAVSKLKEFYNLLDSFKNELPRMLDRLQAAAARENDNHWRNSVASHLEDLETLLDNLADMLGEIKSGEISLDYENLKAAFDELQKIRRADVNENFEITDAEFDNLRDVAAAKIVDIQNNKIAALRKSVEELFAWEHERWNVWMLSRGWKSATVADTQKYIAAGNKKHQCYIAKIHPCIIPFSRLEDLAKALQPALGGVPKPFKDNDTISIMCTKNSLEETFFSEAPESIRDLLEETFFSKSSESIRDLYGAQKF